MYFEDTFRQPLLASVTPEPPQVVIVRNPDTMDAQLGRLVPSLGIGVVLDRPDCQPSTFAPAVVVRRDEDLEAGVSRPLLSRHDDISDL